MRRPKHRTTNGSVRARHRIPLLSLCLSVSPPLPGPQSFVMYVTRSWLLSWHSAIPTSLLAGRVLTSGRDEPRSPSSARISSSSAIGLIALDRRCRGAIWPAPIHGTEIRKPRFHRSRSIWDPDTREICLWYFNSQRCLPIFLAWSWRLYYYHVYTLRSKFLVTIFVRQWLRSFKEVKVSKYLGKEKAFSKIETTRLRIKVSHF